MSVDRKPRFSLKLQIVYDDGASFMSGPVLDMSETGVFIETVMPLEPGTAVRLMPLVKDDDSSVLELEVRSCARPTTTSTTTSIAPPGWAFVLST